MKHLLLLLATIPVLHLNAQDTAMTTIDELPKTIGIEGIEETITIKSDAPVFHLSATGGYGYRVARVSDAEPLIKDYIKKLKSGFALEIDGHFIVNGKLGIGLSYSQFYASNTANDIFVTFEDGTTEFGIKDDIRSNFIGPSLMSRLPSANGLHCLHMVGGFGYLNYTNDSQVGNRLVTSKGATLGVLANLNYDIGLNESVKINLKFSYIAGALNKMELDDGFTTRTIDLQEQFGEAESLSRINLTAGLSILL